MIENNGEAWLRTTDETKSLRVPCPDVSIGSRMTSPRALVTSGRPPVDLSVDSVGLSEIVNSAGVSRTVDSAGISGTVNSAGLSGTVRSTRFRDGHVSSFLRFCGAFMVLLQSL